jgi:uncharacterized protein YbjT (DUF2867 family)
MERPILFGFLGAFDLEQGRAFLWGDGNQPVDLTTYSDSASYTAEVALDEEKMPQKFNVAGDVLTFHELVKTYEEASGQRLTVVEQGSMADLDAQIRHMQTTNPANPWAALPLMAYRAMLKGKLGPLQNDRYPHIHPTTLKEYVARELRPA